MKKAIYCLIALSALVSSRLFAQDWVNMMSNPNVNVHDVQNAFDQWYAQHPALIDTDEGLKMGREEADDQGSELFRRWEYYMAPRTYPTGDRPDMASITAQYTQYLNSIKSNSSSARTTAASNWQYIGNTSVPNFGGGAGRVSRVHFYPGNSNIIYACSPSGGLWKSTNGGGSWSTNTDQLQELGVADIAINPLKPSVMYLATGDNDGIGSGYTPSTIGVLRSANGGTTWASTALSNTLQSSGPTGACINQLAFNPEDTSTLFAATSSGLYYSKNNGNTWTQSINDYIKDVEFEPFHGATVYAGSFTGNFYRSSDSGKTFTQITTGLPTSGVSRLAIGVTAADSNTVYVLAVNSSSSAFYGLYRSTDRGQTFSTMSQTPNILGWSSTGSDNTGQAWYNLAILVSPTNRDSVFVAGSYLWESSNGGATWTFNTNFSHQIHVDIHSLVFYPGSSTSFLLSNDGGVAVTPDAGNSWTDISSNLEIAEQYSIGLSANNPNLWVSGWQDNGSNISSPFWENVYIGDGMTCFIDRTNNNNIFASYEYGSFGVSNNGGASFHTATSGISEQGNWNTPWLQDPGQANTLWAGFKNVWKSTNQGTSWSKVSTWGISNIIALAVAPTNDNYIYAAEPSTIYGSTNAGVTWTRITGSLPVGSASISAIAVNYFDPLELWVCFSGWSSGNKVYKSTNGGSTWTNVSAGLPNLPVNCIVYQPGSADGIYVGTDIGVYYMDNNTGGWIPYNVGLPNVEIFDLKLYDDNTLYAGTFGRGTWQTSTYVSVNTGTNNLSTTTSSVNVYPNPTSGNFKVSIDGMTGQYQVNVINILGQTVYTSTIQNMGHYVCNIDLSGFGKGVYIVSINGADTRMEKKLIVY